MVVLEQLWQAAPGLQQAIGQHTLVTEQEAVWQTLRQLMVAHAPSTGAALPGAIGDQVSDIAAALGMADRLDPEIGGPGSIGLWVGVAASHVDLVIVTHMDRLTFRINVLYDDQTATLTPVCALGTLDELAQTPAKALRFDPEYGHLRVTARGLLTPSPEGLRFDVEKGRLSRLDMVTLDLQPRRQGDWVRGSGLDNVAGVLTALATASVLRRVEETLLEHNRRCLFIFPDRQDVSLSALYRGSGDDSIRPTLGTILVDGQAVDSEALQYEAGMGYAFASAERSGLLVPVNYQQLTWDLAEAFAAYMPAVAQHNYIIAPSPQKELGGYRERILGFMGPPLSHPHAGQELVYLQDIQSSIWWLSCYLAVALNLSPAITARYALGR